MTTRHDDTIVRARAEAIAGRDAPFVEQTFDAALRSLLVAQLARTTQTRFPSPRWRDKPVEFFREVLGVEPWHKQIEVVEAIRDNLRVAVKSGHKVSKSHTAAGVALWFFSSFDDARVVMTSTTSRQVDDILWRETRMMRARAGLCVECKRENAGRGLLEQIEAPCEHSALIGGEIGELARTGLKSEDFREVKGFTAREAEAVAGISGRNLLYILDEASGIKPEIFEAIEGNRAGGARVVMFSNPTKTSGEFYDAFNSKARFYSTHTISSEETPNAVHGDADARAVPGLATRAWIEEKKDEWGVDSPLYKVRVKGEFAEMEEGKIFSIHLIAEAEARWVDTLAVGRLHIGLDPAGDGPTPDETAWAIRRGQRVLAVVTARGLSKEAILLHTLGICREHALPRELPVVVLDREGKVGAETLGTFIAYIATRDDPEFELVALRASDRAHRQPQLYDRLRDNLAGTLLDWIRDGGALPADAKLAAELHALEWEEQEKTGRVKVTSKREIKKLLGRSPDRYDALVLCTWEAPNNDAGASLRRATVADDEMRDDRVPVLDPYAAADSWARP